MKQAFEKGDATPSSTTPTKSKATTNGDTTPTTTTKRKRVSATKKASKDVGKYKPGDEEPDDDEDFTPSKPKRARAGTAKASATTKSKSTKTKANGASTTIKNEAPGDSLPLPTPKASTSFNPTEATTFIKSDPGMNPNRSVEDEEKADEHFYDAVEGVEEEAVAQESECDVQMADCQLCECRADWVANALGVGVQDWLEDQQEI